jgi:hypothetical protein
MAKVMRNRDRLIEKIVSGGQTGVDRAALDVAMELGIGTGGWVPHGRRAEDGVIPEIYGTLTEAADSDYRARTRLNVRDSDATLIFSFGEPRGGTALTHRFTELIGRPTLVVDLQCTTVIEAAAGIREWLGRVRPRVLNVAGPRASQQPRIGRVVREVLRAALDSRAKP